MESEESLLETAHIASTSISSVEQPTESDPKSSPKTEAVAEGEETKEKLSPLKIDILLKSAGDAPIMRKKKWAVDRTKKICWVSDFIKKYLKSEASESLFLYVNQSFAPSPDTDIGSIFDCFGSDGKLVLHYCRTQAWG